MEKEMRELDIEGVAIPGGPESCAGVREGVGEALDALVVGIERKKVNWVLDADIRDFFTSLDHRWLLKFLEHRIADKRVLRLIQKWLKAGVVEDGAWSASEDGSLQGATISPLLANVYLHYVFDLWASNGERGMPAVTCSSSGMPMMSCWDFSIVRTPSGSSGSWRSVWPSFGWGSTPRRRA